MCLHRTEWFRKHVFTYNWVDKKTRVYIEHSSLENIFLHITGLDKKTRV